MLSVRPQSMARNNDLIMSVTRSGLLQRCGLHHISTLCNGMYTHSLRYAQSLHRRIWWFSTRRSLGDWGGKKLAKKKANWRHDHAHRKTDYSTIRGVVATADFFTRFDTAPSLIVIQSQRLIFSLLSLWTGWNTESVSRNKTNTGIMSTLQTERAARSFDAQLSNVCDLVKIGLGHEPAERQTALLSNTHTASDG